GNPARIEVLEIERQRLRRFGFARGAVQRAAQRFGGEADRALPRQKGERRNSYEDLVGAEHLGRRGGRSRLCLVAGGDGGGRGAARFVVGELETHAFGDDTREAPRPGEVVDLQAVLVRARLARVIRRDQV